MSRQSLLVLAAAVVLLTLPAFAGDNQTPDNQAKMTPQTKMLVMRDLTAERVFARKSFPMGSQGLEIKDGKLTPSDQGVARLIMQNGLAAKAGDRVVISNVVIKDKAIIFEINGGPKKHEKWYQHVQMGANGSMSTVGGPPPSAAAHGSLVTLAFDKYIPELTGDQVRDMLAPVFDFKALTVAEAYEKTLPPKVQDAIKNHQVLVGMDRDMVIYAKGRPPRRSATRTKKDRITRNGFTALRRRKWTSSVSRATL